jgi:hypothetical protein
MQGQGQYCKLLSMLAHRLMGSNSKTFLIGRDAKTGELTTVEEARRYPSTHIVERMPKPGRGDSKN